MASIVNSKKNSISAERAMDVSLRKAEGMMEENLTDIRLKCAFKDYAPVLE